MKPIIRKLSRLFACLVLLFALAAQAQPQKDNEGFEKVDSDSMVRGEAIPASRLVALAYGIIFAAVVVWVGSVASRTRRVEDEVEELKRRLQSKG